jgi:cob(I)alamin adenosyltransferase
MGVVTTKTGDKGSTYLKDKVVSKGSFRVDAMGTIDELIANLILTQSITKLDRVLFETPIKKLIEIGSYLAGYKEVPDFKETTEFMEKTIMSRREAYNGFIYPYDDPKNAQINVARTICRRAERTIIRLHEESNQPESLLIFMNRLSDYIFVLIGQM